MAFLAINLFLSCGTVSGNGNGESEEKPAPKTQKDTNAPKWINKYPKNDLFYIGIGSSNSGDKGADMESAQAKARIALSAEISVSIQAEQTYTSKEDSKGNSYETGESVINQTVSQNLEQVEVVDSYYSPKIGYWFYLRLNKATWAAIQRREMKKIYDRVSSLVTPVLGNKKVSEADKLNALGKGWDVLAASPYEGSLKGSLGGKSGLLVDVLETQMREVLKNVSISITPRTVTTEPGKVEKIKVQVKTSSGAKPGPFHIFMAAKDKEDESFAQVVTEDNGIYNGNIKFTDVPAGKTAVMAKINLIELGIAPRNLKGSLIVPLEDFWVDKQQIKIGLKVQDDGGVKVSGMENSAKSLFTEDLPFKIANGKQRYMIVFTLQFRDLPKVLENQPQVTKVRASIALELQGKVIYTYESEEIKSAGIDVKQAHDRVSLKLFKELKKDTNFLDGIKKAFEFE
jgi:hypothetical protein